MTLSRRGWFIPAPAFFEYDSIMMRPKRFVFVAPLVILSLASCFRTVAWGTEEVRVPRCQIEPTAFDGGEVFAGQTVRCTFPVKNTGQGVLKIAVRPSCGCTVARFDEVIQPGGEGKIDVQWKLTSARDGRSAKSISVTTNDPQHPLIKLTVQATVASTVRVLTGNENPIIPSSAGPTTHELVVETRGAPPLEISGASVNASYASVVVHPPELREDKTNVQKLTLTIDSSASMQ